MSGIIRNSLTKIVPTVQSQVTSKATVVSAPPKNPMSFAEKAGMGGAMCVAIVSPMFYILANVKYYKNPTGAAAAE